MKKVLYTSSTMPAIEHVKGQYHWNSDSPIPQPGSESTLIDELRDREVLLRCQIRHSQDLQASRLGRDRGQ